MLIYIYKLRIFNPFFFFNTTNIVIRIPAATSKDICKKSRHYPTVWQDRSFEHDCQLLFTHILKDFLPSITFILPYQKNLCLLFIRTRKYFSKKSPYPLFIPSLIVKYPSISIIIKNSITINLTSKFIIS